MPPDASSDASSDAPTPVEPRPRTAVAKVLALLVAFEGDRASLALTELAQQVGLPLSTTHRLVGELLDAGFLRREPSGRYRVSRRVWKIGQNAGKALQETTRPPLADLVRVTGRMSQLAVRDGRDALIVDRVLAPGRAPQLPGVGDRLPLHASAFGMAILAFEERSRQDAYLARPLSETARAAQVDPAALARQLAAIRRDGHALAVDEGPAGSASIAVPVLIGRQRPVGAVGLIAPAAHSRRLVGLLPALRRTATALGREAPRWPPVGPGGPDPLADAGEDRG